MGLKIDIESAGVILRKVVLAAAGSAREIDAKRKETKERFNIFSCLTRHHSEELHSRFIAYMLDPKGEHDCDEVFLKLFLEHVSKDEPIKKALESLPSNLLKEAKVRREYSIGTSAESDIYGRIDILIDIDNFLIVIENKIRAGEQPGQIKRYVDYCETHAGKRYVCFYLTPWGMNSNQAEGRKYSAISYEKDIIPWLKSCKQHFEQDRVTYGIDAYLDMLQKSILDQKASTMNTELTKLLLEPENAPVLEHLFDIHEATISVRNQLRSRFFECLARYFKDEKLACTIYPESSAEKIWKTIYRGFEFTDESLIVRLPAGYTVRLELQHDWHSLFYGLVAYPTATIGERKSVIPNEKPELSELEARMKEKLPNQLRDVDNVWFAWRDFDVLNKKLDFSDDRLNRSFSESMDTIIDQFKEEFGPYVKAWKEVCASKKPSSINP